MSSPEPTPCPPIAGFTERTVTVPLRAATPLPDGGQVRLVEVTPASGGGDASVKLELTRPGCGSTELVLPQGGGAAASSVRVDVVSVNPSRNGMPPTAQLRIGPA